MQDIKYGSVMKGFYFVRISLCCSKIKKKFTSSFIKSFAVTPELYSGCLPFLLIICEIIVSLAGSLPVVKSRNSSINSISNEWTWFGKTHNASQGGSMRGGGQEGGAPSAQAYMEGAPPSPPPNGALKYSNCNTFMVFAVRSCLSVGCCCKCCCCAILWLTSNSVFTQPSSTCRF